jgi:hypothetical protein
VKVKQFFAEPFPGFRRHGGAGRERRSPAGPDGHVLADSAAASVAQWAVTLRFGTSPLCELGTGNPYIGSKTQNGFGTFGQPDIAATLVAVAGKAIREVWYQKWWVHLRHRPESGAEPSAGPRPHLQPAIPYLAHKGGRHQRDYNQPLSTGSLPHAVMTWYSETSR